MPFRPPQEIISTDTVYMSCRVATTANIALRGAKQTIDSILLGPGDRVLVKNQNAVLENGIYTVTPAGFRPNDDWVRGFDMEYETRVINGKLVFVREGARNSNRLFAIRFAGPLSGPTVLVGFDQLSFPSIRLT